MPILNNVLKTATIFSGLGLAVTSIPAPLAMQVINYKDLLVLPYNAVLDVTSVRKVSDYQVELVRLVLFQTVLNVLQLLANVKAVSLESIWLARLNVLLVLQNVPLVQVRLTVLNVLQDTLSKRKILLLLTLSLKENVIPARVHVKPVPYPLPIAKLVLILMS